MNRYLVDPRTWLIGGVVTALLVVLLGWLILIGPELRIKVASLKAKSAKSDQYAATLRQAEAALPYDSGLPAFTRQLNAEALAAGVDLGSLVVSGVTPVETTTTGTASPGFVSSA